MGYFSIFLIALGLSMDSLAVSISGGILMKRFSARQTCKVALILGIFQGGMTLLGWLLGYKFQHFIEPFDHWIAFILLGYLGGKMIHESLKEKKDDNFSFSNKTLFTLGVATSLDAMAVGVSFAFLDMGILSPVLIITLVTIFLSFSGLCCGVHFRKYEKLKVECIGGIILLLIGTKILLEHTLLV